MKALGKVTGGETLLREEGQPLLLRGEVVAAE
jgi:hypothetical protein